MKVLFLIWISISFFFARKIEIVTISSFDFLEIWTSKWQINLNKKCDLYLNFYVHRYVNRYIIEKVIGTYTMIQPHVYCICNSVLNCDASWPGHLKFEYGIINVPREDIAHIDRVRSERVSKFIVRLVMEFLTRG